MTVSEFIVKKSEHTIGLCHYFIKVYIQMGEITPHVTKTMIVFRANKNFAYIVRLGKHYVDIVLPFKTAYADNLCFNKILHVPGSTDFNHHLRIYTIDDINDEVKHYMKLAYANGRGI